jgi:hypothetical protein
VASNVALLPTHLQVRSEHPRLSQRLSPAAVHRSNGKDPYFAGYLLLSSHVAPTATSYSTPSGSLFTTQTGPLYRSVGSNHVQWSATLRLRHNDKVKGGSVTHGILHIHVLETVRRPELSSSLRYSRRHRNHKRGRQSELLQTSPKIFGF